MAGVLWRLAFDRTLRKSGVTGYISKGGYIDLTARIFARRPNVRHFAHDVMRAVVYRLLPPLWQFTG